jgi:hypothetical protein
VFASQVFTKLLKWIKFSSDQKIVREGFFIFHFNFPKALIKSNSGVGGGDGGGASMNILQ